MFEVEYFEWEKHGEIYNRWFLEHEALKPMDEIVSPLGIVVIHHKKPICIGFLCKTDSKVALITNFISDPKSEKDIRSTCLDILINALSEEAKSDGFLILGAASPIPAVCKRFEKHGMIKTHENVNNYGRFYAVDSAFNSGSGGSSGESAAQGSATTKSATD